MPDPDSTGHPAAPALFDRGFRPFFLLAGLWAPVALLLWLSMLAGIFDLPTAMDRVAWHVHEMLFGFVAAAIAGFLLTAVPGWTGRPPLRGLPLAALAVLWFAGRLAVALSMWIGAAAAAAIDIAFLATLAALCTREIAIGRNWRNLAVIALLAGFIIFPAGFSIAGFDPTAGGPGLIFAVLPQLFATLPGGLLFGAAFFLLLSVAAFTSTISLLEVPVAHAIDQWRWPRRKAVLAVGAFTFAFSIPSVLSFGGGFFSELPAVGGTFFDLMVNVWNEGALPVGGMLIRLFIGWT